MKDFGKKSLEDDKFTNKEQLEYPLETDIVNIKVLNNNTKLLNEKISKVTGDIGGNLKNVAQESSPKYIENQVKKLDNIDTNVNDIESIVRSMQSKSNGGSIVGTVDVFYKSTVWTNSSLVETFSYNYNNSNANSCIFIGNAVFSNDKYALGCVVPVQCSSGSSSATLKCDIGSITTALGSGVSLKFQIAGKLILLKI